MRASDIIEGDDSDYRFRLRAKKEDVAKALSELVLGIRYGNFKAEVAAKQGTERHDIYTDVWAILTGLQV